MPEFIALHGPHGRRPKYGLRVRFKTVLGAEHIGTVCRFVVPPSSRVRLAFSVNAGLPFHKVFTVFPSDVVESWYELKLS